MVPKRTEDASFHIIQPVTLLTQLLPTGKFTEDRWLKKTGGRSVVGDALGAVGIGSGGDLLNARGGGGSMINVNGECGVTKMKTRNIQRSAKGFVKFVPALAYNFFLNLPAAFTQPGASASADVSTVSKFVEHPNSPLSIRKNFRGMKFSDEVHCALQVRASGFRTGSRS